MSRRGGRVLALDVGERRIGVAVSDESGAIATPLTVVAVPLGDGRGKGRRGDDLGEIARLVAAWEADRLVVGLPTGLSGREGPQAAQVRAYTAALAARLDPALPIDFWDERLTTAIAERTLIAGGARRAERKARIDAVAAAVILQSYLDARRRRADDGRETGDGRRETAGEGRER